MKKTLCAEIGHSWQTTTVTGYVACNRLSCNAVAYCPGCLGYCLSGKLVVLCSIHTHCDLGDLPVCTLASGATFLALSAEQLPLF